MGVLKGAIIGCGDHGRVHARCAQQLGVELVGFCDVIEASAEQAREEFGGHYATSDARRIMRDDSIDLLIIATHHDAHHLLALAGAQAGKHMLLEKPMCLTLPQAVEVADAVEAAGVKLVIDHWFRMTPAAQKTRELLPHPRLSHGQLAMSDSGAEPGNWIWRPDDGGGLLLATACHTVDLLSYLMDSDADRVYAEGRLFEPTGKGTEGYHDGLVGTILWKSGALSTVISADQGFNPFVSKWFHEVWDGQRSAVLSAHMRRADFSGCEVDYVDARELPRDEEAKVTGPYPIHANLLEAINTGGETICTVRDGVQTVAICNALEKAARTGQPQAVRY